MTKEHNQDDKSRENTRAPEFVEGYFVPLHANEKADEINVLQILAILKSSIRCIYICTFAVFLLGLLYAYISVPVFRSQALIAPVERDSQVSGKLGALASQFGGLANLAGISLPSGGDLETTIAILNSRQFIVKFINDRKLKQHLFAERWDDKNGKWIYSESLIKKMISKVLMPPMQLSGNGDTGEPTDWEAYRLFTKDILKVSQDSKSSLVTVSVDWKDPQKASVWANELIDILNNDIRKRTIEDAKNSINYLKEQVQQTSVADLRTILYRLIEEHAKNITLAQIDKEYAIKVIDPAVPAEVAIKPKPLQIMFLSIVLGLLVAILIAFSAAWIRK